MEDERMINLPNEFEEKMKALLGDEFEDYIKCYDEPRYYGLRVNTEKISVEDFVKICPFEITPIPWIDNGFYYDGEKISPAKHPYYFAGLYYLQEPSAMTPANRLPVEPGDRVLDVCAAPGGKSIHIAELLNGTGHVEARDLTEYKVDLIRDNIERSGLTNIEAVCQDATVYDPDKKKSADIVIADLPCSGLGVLGKKPDLRYKMNEKTEADLVELQRKILSVVKDYVKPDGKLLYSTCTIHREENEGNVEWFLKEYPEFELVKDKQMIPGKDAGDGFYIAIIKRVNHE